MADFGAVLCLANHDLLRPDGRYVGFSIEADLSIKDDQPGTPPTTPHPDIARSAPGNLEDDSDEDDGDDGGDRDDEDDGGSADLEDLLPDSADKPLDGSNCSMEDWLEINGQHYLKASLVSQHLKANRSKKVVERTLWVCGLTLDNLQK